ncbi:Small G protein signaling modulator 3 [Branchiostoma belcheri]|nr:Small G protein signaling modulator 3 [Branchiostoma belcheri]
MALSIAESLTEEEDETSGPSDHGSGEGVSVAATSLLGFLSSPSGNYSPSPGGPFSALTPSMWPQDILAKIAQTEDSEGQPEFRYDEFGFRVEEEDAAEPMSNKLLSTPLTEDPQNRLKWQAYLEFTHNHEVGDLTWDKIEATLQKSEKLNQLVMSGIPHSMREQLWLRLSGALQKKVGSETSYKDIVKASSDDNSLTAKQIEKDLLRTMPRQYRHSRLRRILRGLAWLYPDIGYCQGTGMIAACLLLFMEEEEAFWMMCAIVEDLVPASYFSSSLIGVQADQRVLRQLIVSYLPKLDGVLKEHDIELSLITLHWFLTAFASVVHIKLLLRLWDLFFYEGSIILFKITLGMLKMKASELLEEELCELENSAAIFNALSDIPGDIQDVDELIEMAMQTSGSLTDVVLEAHRRKHLAYLMADQGQIINPDTTATNLPKQEAGEEEQSEVVKAKNIKQTEMVSNLREAILQIAKHFQSVDPKNCNLDLQADYSLESHKQDHENFVNVSRNRRRRAKALLDFERHDDDELGFRKNDIITIISQKDEHCWVGELNGLRGWFPAKFVELLDERSKLYTTAGDDQVTEAITDLVRGTLCPALKMIFDHGLRQPSILGRTCHPWLFIEEDPEQKAGIAVSRMLTTPYKQTARRQVSTTVTPSQPLPLKKYICTSLPNKAALSAWLPPAAQREVEKDFDSVYSRLVLCKTYRPKAILVTKDLFQLQQYDSKENFIPTTTNTVTVWDITSLLLLLPQSKSTVNTCPISCQSAVSRQGGYTSREADSY